MKIQQISFKNNFQTEQKTSSVKTPVIKSVDVFESSNKKDNTKKYIFVGVGVLALIIAIAKHKQIGEFLKGLSKKGKKNVDNVETSNPLIKIHPVDGKPPIGNPSLKPQPPVNENPAPPKVDSPKPTPRVERIIPKFKCEHPVGSKEYFDARLKYIDKTAFEIASAKDEEGFIKFLDEFDALQNITKSTNKGAFTEFGGMKASFYLFKEGQRSDKLLSRFLDTYHNHIEDFGNNLGNASNCGALILKDFYREYGPVSSKATIMKLLKEFERTGTDEYISVKGIGEPFAMQYYFKHLPPVEQKEITTESDRVSNILRDRASKVSKNENNINKGN